MDAGIPSIPSRLLTYLLILLAVLTCTGKRGGVRHGDEHDRAGDLRDGSGDPYFLGHDQGGAVEGGRAAGAWGHGDCMGTLYTISIPCEHARAAALLRALSCAPLSVLSLSSDTLVYIGRRSAATPRTRRPSCSSSRRAWAPSSATGWSSA